MSGEGEHAGGVVESSNGDTWAPSVTRPGYDSAKRAFDVGFSVVVLTLTAPVIGIAAAALRIESSGSPFFWQERMGRGGRPFRLLKLRGMYVDSEARFPELYDYSHESADPSSIFFHFDSDPRVTRVARVLRRYSLDELPNFWNVLRGDMSVVGPRPEIPEMAHLYGTDLAPLLSVLPGVTSPAKASGRDHLSFAETLASDLDYVENRSFRLDLVIIVRTIVAALTGRKVLS
jgi:lipopolysaccharide/colanic/teichoic acid biosynthesis glycosyltransferase